ncbi:hypothetical protein BD311DRAFT_767530 [Dichomitus squalens]|uniref:Uncharacterized protein n=1 Tax=Dichomitus squalens TaxID=114155 RepID=A0A4V2JZ73_9APHY|nr:hypothetical protein BD311DRAFT_767530 [Dichomitus squalens]
MSFLLASPFNFYRYPTLRFFCCSARFLSSILPVAVAIDALSAFPHNGLDTLYAEAHIPCSLAVHLRRRGFGNTNQL